MSQVCYVKYSIYVRQFTYKQIYYCVTNRAHKINALQRPVDVGVFQIAIKLSHPSFSTILLSLLKPCIVYALSVI